MKKFISSLVLVIGVLTPATAIARLSERVILINGTPTPLSQAPAITMGMGGWIPNKGGGGSSSASAPAGNGGVAGIIAAPAPPPPIIECSVGETRVTNQLNKTQDKLPLLCLL